MRSVWIALAACLVAFGLAVVFGIDPDRLRWMIVRAISVLASLACPVFFLTMLLAPGLGYGIRHRVGALWERVRTRRAEISELNYRINQLGRAHHMAQLGSVYLRQGRHHRAAEWFAKALEKDDESVDTRYKLALCRFQQRRYSEAAELLEQVYSRKPEHDYGGVYLRLARAQELIGNPERAREVYATLLRFYPGHPEGTYRYAQLLQQQGEWETAREHLRQMLHALRRSPAFQRRRNRHWMLKAQWWLWRHPGGASRS